MKALVRVMMAALLATLALNSHAGLFRAYLSSQGSDSNPCTLPAPCRLLPAALGAVNDGGEIWMLDSANFNTAQVLVAKSVTISAVPGALGSVIASGSAAILVDAPTAKVAFRNLVIRNLAAGTSGIVFNQGLQLAVEDCEIVGMPDRGISVVGGNNKVTIRNTIVRDSGYGGIEFQFASNATLDHVTVRNSAIGIRVAEASVVSITDSVIADNSGFGVLVESTFGGVTQVVVERSILNANQTGLALSAASGIGSRANAVLRRNTLSGNDLGVYVGTSGSVTASAALEENVIAQNGVGVSIAGNGTSTVLTRQDNTFHSNTGGDVSGSLTPLAPL